MNTSIEKILVDIIKHEMDLPDNYGIDLEENEIPSVLVTSQNIKLYRTDELQISIGFVDARPILNKSNIDFSVTPPREINSVVQAETFNIDMMSRNNDARDRRWEVVSALRSFYSEQKQNENNFKIFKMPRSFVNASQADGGSDINRFTLVITCHVWYNKVKELTNNDYYDQFPTAGYIGDHLTSPCGDFDFIITAPTGD